jgi:hypothetical protein
VLVEGVGRVFVSAFVVRMAALAVKGLSLSACLHTQCMLLDTLALRVPCRLSLGVGFVIRNSSPHGVEMLYRCVLYHGVSAVQYLSQRCLGAV